MAEIKEVDCRGLACPQPVINTKRALESIESGKLITIVDNDVAKENVSLFARNAGCQVDVEPKEGHYFITITKNNAVNNKTSSMNQREAPSDAQNMTHQTPDRIVYFFSTNMLGQGSPELGMVLMKSLFSTIVEMEPAPKALLFLNTGVYLTCEGSPVMEHIRTLAERGTQLISCGTCLDYYKLKEKLAVGIIGNMYAINELLVGPEKVITIA